MSEPAPKLPPPDPDAEKFPAQQPPVREPDEPDPDVINPTPEPLPA